MCSTARNGQLTGQLFLALPFVLARTAIEGGNRGLSLFMVDKSELNPSQYYNLPKIKTHGIRAADMSGIGFSDCFIPKEHADWQSRRGIRIGSERLSDYPGAVCRFFSRRSRYHHAHHPEFCSKSTAL